MIESSTIKSVSYLSQIFFHCGFIVFGLGTECAIHGTTTVTSVDYRTKSDDITPEFPSYSIGGMKQVKQLFILHGDYLHRLPFTQDSTIQYLVRESFKFGDQVILSFTNDNLSQARSNGKLVLLDPRDSQYADR